MFYIQASNPVNNSEYDINDTKIMEAIETIFPMRTEMVIMVWNHICIPLSYKYDISYMVDDIINILKELVAKKEGCIKVNWLPDTFCCQWVVKWKENIVKISAIWNNVIGDILEPLNSNSDISMNKFDFINEWEQVFYNIKKALQECGYNDINLEDMSQLIQINSLFTNKGILYQ